MAKIYITIAVLLQAVSPSWLTSAITHSDLRGLNGHFASPAFAEEWDVKGKGEVGVT